MREKKQLKTLSNKDNILIRRSKNKELANITFGIFKTLIGGGGGGNVNSVNSVLPDENKNVYINAENIDYLKKDQVSDFVSSPGAPVILTQQQYDDLMASPEGYIEVNGEKFFKRLNIQLSNVYFKMNTYTYGALPNELQSLLSNDVVVPENQPYWRCDIKGSVLDEGFDVGYLYMFAAKIGETERYGWEIAMYVKMGENEMANAMGVSSETFFKSLCFNIENAITVSGLTDVKENTESELNNIGERLTILESKNPQIIYVSSYYFGIIENGSIDYPFSTISKAINHVDFRSIGKTCIVLLPGSYGHNTDESIIDVSDKNVIITSLFNSSNVFSDYSLKTSLYLGENNFIANNNTRLVFDNIRLQCDLLTELNVKNIDFYNCAVFGQPLVTSSNVDICVFSNCLFDLNMTLKSKTKIENCRTEDNGVTNPFELTVDALGKFVTIINSDNLSITHNAGILKAYGCHFPNELSSTAILNNGNLFSLDRCSIKKLPMFSPDVNAEALGKIIKTGDCNYFITGCIYDTVNSTLQGTGTIM